MRRFRPAQASRSSSRGRPFDLAALSLAVFFTAASGASCHRTSGAANPERSERVPVRVTRAVAKDYAHKITGSGLLSADRTVQLSFKTGGIIAGLNVKEGDNVRKGQLLARLDLGEIRASAQMAEAGFAKAQRDVDRAQALFSDGVATTEQLQDATTALDVARSNREIAAFNLRHSAIRAPHNGRILRRLAEPGELTSPGRPIFTFGSTSHAWVIRIGVTDRDIVRLRRGDTATVTFDAHPGEPIDAHVADLAAAANPQSGTFDVELEMARAQKELLAGMVARVQINAGAPRQLPFLPFAAITEGRGDRAYVFLADEAEHRAHRVEIGLAAIVGAEVVVADGLDAGSLVVLDGSAYLKDGDAIEITGGVEAGSAL